MYSCCSQLAHHSIVKSKYLYLHSFTFDLLELQSENAVDLGYVINIYTQLMYLVTEPSILLSEFDKCVIA